MLNIFSKILDPEKILDVQNLQYTEKLLLEDEVPASSMEMAKVNISSLGHFYSLFLTGKFTTLKEVTDEVPIVVDTAICYLRGKLIDGSNTKPLFNDYIPLDLFLSPGRTKSDLSAAFLTDPVSNSLFYPQPFQYMFTVNSEIQFECKNDSNYKNKYWIVFHGVRFPARQTEKRRRFLTK
jgi:hypothetical protein